MLPLVLQEIVHNVKKQYELPEPRWVDETPTEEDMAILEREAAQTSSFDKVNYRKEMWDALVEGRASILCRTCDYGKVLVISSGEDLGISWSTWARILQGFGVAAEGATEGARQGGVRICWYASPKKRFLPPDGGAVGPEHVNGGYTVACETSAIVIYRIEEATRVLIHEMLHASCTDHAHDPTEVKEAKTETWAELFLIAYASKGDAGLAERLWKIQAVWIAEVNGTLERVHGVYSTASAASSASSTAYSARYTLDRVGVLKSAGIEGVNSRVPTRSHSRKPKSSRFTSETLDKYL